MPPRADHSAGAGPRAAGSVLALLHTSPVHVPVFDALQGRHHPGLRLRHTVDGGLLARARSHGPEAVAEAVRSALAGAVAGGAGAVLCTCSTIGAVAERCAADVGVPVLRVDRPMAAAAAAHRRIAVVATVASTLAPTVTLIGEERARAERGRGAAVRAERLWEAPAPADREQAMEPAVPEGSGTVRTHVVARAWERFESGDHDGCLDLVAAAVDSVREADVVVLAQASMAAAAARVTTSVPVLSSPRTGLAAAVRAVGAGAVEGGAPSAAHPAAPEGARRES
ncbi:hypothetical protein [Streptomyces sp. NPDC049887]|uniref:hypothetical protein n=1 Tax=Streptomyces sp. NPDC049887 TaxID=3155654 RepID=UPI003434D7DB